MRTSFSFRTDSFVFVEPTTTGTTFGTEPVAQERAAAQFSLVAASFRNAGGNYGAPEDDAFGTEPVELEEQVNFALVAASFRNAGGNYGAPVDDSFSASRIPVPAPEWTDFNTGDPGIALIEFS